MGAEDFLKRILINNKTSWWEDLKSETNTKKGKCLQRALEEELAEYPEYRGADRRLFFFSKSKSSTIDGYYKTVGVEEKFNHLDLKEHLIDGAIHRGFIWVFGRPQNISGSLESVSLYVVQNDSSPMTEKATDLYFPIIHTLHKYGINIVFVDGKTGESWYYGRDHNRSLPRWLSVKGSPTIWDKGIDHVERKNHEVLKVLSDPALLKKKEKSIAFIPELGKSGEFQEVVINETTRGAIIDYKNEWRLIEIGLLLRSYGYDAVKVIYNKSKHKNMEDKSKIKVPAGMGVEQRVAHEMLNRFSVSLDWCVDI